MSGEWQPIETAPRDGTRILLWCNCDKWSRAVIGAFDIQKYHAKPRPYWNYGWLGVGWARQNPPRYWQPLPEPPKEEK